MTPADWSSIGAARMPYVASGSGAGAVAGRSPAPRAATSVAPIAATPRTSKDLRDAKRMRTSGRGLMPNARCHGGPVNTAPPILTKPLQFLTLTLHSRTFWRLQSEEARVRSLEPSTLALTCIVGHA